MAFDLDLECAKAIERINRGIGQRWRHAKAETKRMADEARAQISVPTYERKPVTVQLGGHFVMGMLHTGGVTVVPLADGPTDGGY